MVSVFFLSISDRNFLVSIIPYRDTFCVEMTRKSEMFVHIVIYVLTLALCEEVDTRNPHRDPSKCEVCKYVVGELEGNLLDTAKSHEVFKIGHMFDKEKKEVKYTHSETRLIEVLEGVCERILNYNIHAERDSSRRFAKGRSETMQTLTDLQNKGVKVELGIPQNMWDVPSAPVYKMKQYCDTLIEGYEEVIENWYFEEPSNRKDLTTLLCIDNYLPKGDQECLKEVWTGKERVNFEDDPEEEKEKKEKKKNSKKEEKSKINSKKNNKNEKQMKEKGKTLHAESENVQSAGNRKLEL